MGISSTTLTPLLHGSKHESGGIDEIDITNLTGLLTHHGYRVTTDVLHTHDSLLPFYNHTPFVVLKTITLTKSPTSLKIQWSHRENADTRVSNTAIFVDGTQQGTTARNDSTGFITVERTITGVNPDSILTLRGYTDNGTSPWGGEVKYFRILGTCEFDAAEKISATSS